MYGGGGVVGGVVDINAFGCMMGKDNLVQDSGVDNGIHGANL